GAVHRLDDPGEVQDAANLVALQMADEVPLDRPPFEGAGLFHQLLDAVFAKERHPRLERLEDALRRLRLAREQEADLAGVPTRGAAGVVDPPAHLLDGGRDLARPSLFHSQPVSRNRLGAMHTPREETLRLNGLLHRIWTWEPASPRAGTILCAHGFLDVGRSFQMVAASLA